MQPKERWFDLENIRLHAREWQPVTQDPTKPIFLLYHGLSSNAATWDLVARRLARAGFHTVAVNQRGHGRSDKPDTGYDFETVAADVRAVVDRFDSKDIILAGQSWGGNVLLEVAARYPGLALGYIFVDGGFLNLRQRGPWERVSIELRPPDSTGLHRSEIAARIGEMFPTWAPEGVEATLQNFEHLPDGTVRPWLTLDRHMKILRALYDQDVEALYPQVHEPVLLCPASNQNDWSDEKRRQVAVAEKMIPKSEVIWFEDTAHDIHVDHPEELTTAMSDFSQR
jgi:pimeloyl-ACP methyl ester carboxylesterase